MLVGRFLEAIEQAIGGEWYTTDMFGEAGTQHSSLYKAIRIAFAA